MSTYIVTFSMLSLTFVLLRDFSAWYWSRRVARKQILDILKYINSRTDKHSDKQCVDHEEAANTARFLVWQSQPETKTCYLVKPQTDTLRRPHTHGNTNISIQIHFNVTTLKTTDWVTCRVVIDEIQCATSFNRHLIKTGKSAIYNLPLRKHDVIISNSKPTACTKGLLFHSVGQHCQHCTENAHHPPYLLQPLGIILHYVLKLLDLLAGKLWLRWWSVSLERVGIVLRATGFRLPAGTSSGCISLR